MTTFRPLTEVWGRDTDVQWPPASNQQHAEIQRLRDEVRCILGVSQTGEPKVQVPCRREASEDDRQRRKAMKVGKSKPHIVVLPRPSSHGDAQAKICQAGAYRLAHWRGLGIRAGGPRISWLLLYRHAFWR